MMSFLEEQTSSLVLFFVRWKNESRDYIFLFWLFLWLFLLCSHWQSIFMCSEVSVDSVQAFSHKTKCFKHSLWSHCHLTAFEYCIFWVWQDCLTLLACQTMMAFILLKISTPISDGCSFFAATKDGFCKNHNQEEEGHSSSFICFWFIFICSGLCLFT